MADFSQPSLTSNYVDFLNDLKERDDDILKMLDGTSSTGLPVGTKRWNSINNYWEKYNGTSWSTLTTEYNINVSSVNGASLDDNGTSTSSLWSGNKIGSVLNTKLNATNYNASDVLSKIKTVDGIGSGLDADLLDGKEGAYYAGLNAGSNVQDPNVTTDVYIVTKNANCPNNSEYWHIRTQFYNNINSTANRSQIAISFQGAPRAYIRHYNSAWTSWVRVDNAEITAQDILTKIKTVDGISSGLDADLLDGKNSNTEAVANTICSRDQFGNIKGNVGNFNATLYSSNYVPTAPTQRDISDYASTSLVAFIRQADGSTIEEYTTLDSLRTALGSSAGTGGGNDDVFIENSLTVTTDYTITAGKSAVSAGDITIGVGVTVTIPDGSRWVIV